MQRSFILEVYFVMNPLHYSQKSNTGYLKHCVINIFLVHRSLKAHRDLLLCIYFGKNAENEKIGVSFTRKKHSLLYKVWFYQSGGD